MASQHILIVGAGICGLSIAHGLKQAGISFDIFEAEAESAFRPREWTMALHWSIPMLQKLLPTDLALRLDTDAVVDKSLNYDEPPNNTIKVVDGIDGHTLRVIAPEGRLIRVSRRKLRSLCSEGINVKFDHTLRDVVYNDDHTTTAEFTNGNSYTGTILIGTDGARSCVREKLVGPEAAKNSTLPSVYTNLTTRYPNADQALFVRSAHPVTSLMAHPDCVAFVSIQDVPDPDQPETWRFQIAVNWRGTSDKTLSNDENLRIVKERVANLQEPYRSAVQWIPEGSTVLFSDLSYWIAKPWDTRAGRVTLAGDAAHSMPPHRGQGLNNAINDAYNFVEAIKKVSAGQEGQAQAVQAYSDEVAHRGAQETQLSLASASLMLDYTEFLNSPVMKHGVSQVSGK